MQRSNLINHPKHQTGSIVTGGRAAFSAQHKKPGDVLGQILDIALAQFQVIPIRRRGSFEEVELALTAEEARSEAGRCLRCDFGKSVVSREEE